MALRVIPLDRIDAADAARWRDLAERACEPNPFFEPDFVLPAAAELGRGAALAVVERDGDWLGVLPVRRGRAIGVMRTWCSPYCFLGTPLLDRDAPTDALAALLRRGRFVVLERQRADGPVAAALSTVLGERGLVTVYDHRHERAALVRRPAEDYLDGMRAHHKREYKRQRRRLEEHLGAPLEVHDRSEDATATDRFTALERSGWKGAAGTALGSRNGHADFFRAVCTRFRAPGRLEMLELTAGDHTVAMKCNLAAGDGMFCFKIAHDESLSRSPGVQLELAYVGHFHGNRSEAWADSCAAPDNAMINRLWPDRLGIGTFAFSRRGAQAVLSRRGLRTLQTLRARERSAPSLTS